MANYSTLKAAVADVVKTNGSQAITGANLQTVLLSIINSIGGGGYIFAGVATPSTDVGTPDQNVFYITGAGTFANMGTSTTVPVGSIGVFRYNGSWSSSTVKLFDGIDDVPTGASSNLAKSGGTLNTINSYQTPAGKLTRQTKITNLKLIDNTYIGNDGNIHYVEPASYHYQSLYMYPIHNYQRIELFNFYASGNSRLILYDSSMNILSNSNATGNPYVINNAAGTYHYMSFGTNIANGMVEMTVTPRVVDEIAKFIRDGAFNIDVPQDLVSDKLIINNQFSAGVSGFSSVYGLYIGNYATINFIPFSGLGSAYKYVWLTDAEGVVTTLNYPSSGNLFIDNTDGTYKFMSYNRKDIEINGRIMVTKANIEGAVNSLTHDISDIEEHNMIDDIRTMNVLTDVDIIEDYYIDSKGQLKPFSETSTTKFCAVYYYPVSRFDKFTVSGHGSGSSVYTKLYDKDLQEIGSYQQRNQTIDNSDHSVAYVSFASSVNSYGGIYLLADGQVRVDDATQLDMNPMLVSPHLHWVKDTYMNSTNVCNIVDEGDTYKYYSVPNYYCKDATRIVWNLALGGSARVVTTDENHDIINVYTQDSYDLDNSDGDVAYISLTNNVKRVANPLVKMLRKPLVNEAVEAMSANAIGSPLENKNIAVLGDSIMMMMDGDQTIFGDNVVTYRDDNDNVYELADLTNIGGLLYVTSSLSGGQVVSDSIRVDVHNSNQAGMDEATWITLKDALKANYIINTGKGGATIMGDTITTAYPAFNESTFNTMPNHCLELKRRVDAGEPTPDIIMVWAGTNGIYKFIVDGQWVEPTNFDEVMALDYETQLLADTAEAMNYKKTIYGAMRFCLEYLYRTFPNAVVVFFSPIPSVVPMRTFERLRKVGGYIRNMCERYSALFVDACIEMGITDLLDTETNHVWLYDGLHPNAAGKVLYCNYTAKKLSEIFFSKV